jgi:hypothetical protein
MPVIWGGRQEEYFPQWGWTDFWVICPPGGFVESVQEIRLCAQQSIVAPASEPGPIRRAVAFG